MHEETFGQRVTRLRGLRPGKKHGTTMSRAELAIAIEVPSGRTLVTRWENDDGIPSSQWLEPLSQALECSVDYLLTGAESTYVGRHEGPQAPAASRPAGWGHD